MGRMRDKYESEKAFCRGVEEEFHRVAGLLPRKAEIERRMVGYESQQPILEAAAAACGTTYPVTLDGIRRRLERNVPQGPTVALDTPLELWDSVPSPTGSFATPLFDFRYEPEWDLDDIAEYACAPHALKSFRYRLVNRWLVPRAKFLLEGENRETAMQAVCRSFGPLADSLVSSYRVSGSKACGEEGYEKLESQVRGGLLRGLVDEFDYFWKKRQRFAPGKYLPMPDPVSRRAASIYDDIEYPLSAFLHRKLDEHLRSAVGLPKGSAARRRGPFRIVFVDHEGRARSYPDLVCLREDVESELRLTDNAIRKHRTAARIKAWQARDFRRVLGISSATDFELVPECDVIESRSAEDVEEIIEGDFGEYREITPEERPFERDEDESICSGNWKPAEPLVITGDSYWIYDWDSVQAMWEHWDGKSFRFEKPGPKATR